MSDVLSAPCSEVFSPEDIDMGMREVQCVCGDRHAVVMDVHPPTRFLPAYLIETLRSITETADAYEEFDTAHLMGAVIEEYPNKITVTDATSMGTLGCGVVWITAFDSRRLHEVIVELILELMDHAMAHAEDSDQMAEFKSSLAEFDIEVFVDEYRDQRDEDESAHDP